MIALDTHACLWWLSNPALLSSVVGKAIDHAASDGSIAISCISAWEVAVLVRKGRLELTMPTEDWIARSEALPFLRFVPVDNRIVVKSTNLPGSMREDPADRIIIATSPSLGATLVTKDDKIQNHPHVKSLW